MTGLLRWFLVLLLTAGTANAALAQNMNSRLTGVVKDAQGAVLPGVAVTATSPALIGSQTATTEANGTFLFPQLPPGTYALSFELSGFQTGKRQNIGLALGATLNIDMTMQLATLQESVTVRSLNTCLRTFITISRTCRVIFHQPLRCCSSGACSGSAPPRPQPSGPSSSGWWVVLPSSQPTSSCVVPTLTLWPN